MQTVQSFYATSLEYFDMWEVSYAPFKLFSWMNLRGTITWDMFEKSLEDLIEICKPVVYDIDDNALL